MSDDLTCSLLRVTQLDPSIYESLQKERVEVGDVIYIEANSGAVKVRTIHNLLLSSLNTRWFRVLRLLYRQCSDMLWHEPKDFMFILILLMMAKQTKGMSLFMYLLIG